MVKPAYNDSSLLKNPCLSVGNILAVPFHMLLAMLTRLKIGH